MSYKRVVDPDGRDVWTNLKKLSQQPPSPKLTDADRNFIRSAVLHNVKSYDRIRAELVHVIERLTGEQF